MAGIGGLGLGGGFNPLALLMAIANANPQAFSQLFSGTGSGQQQPSQQPQQSQPQSSSSSGQPASNTVGYFPLLLAASQILGMNQGGLGGANSLPTFGMSNGLASNSLGYMLPGGGVSAFMPGGGGPYPGSEIGVITNGPQVYGPGTNGLQGPPQPTSPSSQRFTQPIARQGTMPSSQGYNGAANGYQSPNQGGYGGPGPSEMTNPGMGTLGLFGFGGVGMPSSATLFPNVSQPASIGALSSPQPTAAPQLAPHPTNTFQPNTGYQDPSVWGAGA